MNQVLNNAVKIGMTANILEWYDFSVYASMASIIGEIFFGGDQKLAFIKALLVFSVSYLARPLGSIFFGLLADKFGRKLSLQISLVMMAIPTILIGFLPQNSNSIYYSILALLVLRILQGFAAGGELPTSACYIYEIAPSHQKNFLCSFVAASSMFGVFTGSFVVYLLHVFLNFSASYAYLSNSLGLLSLVLFALLMGLVIKEHQRKQAIAFGIIFIIALSYPLFLLLNQKNIILIIAVQIIFAFGLSAIAGVIYATINSLFEVNMRCSGISIGFTAATAIFGGLSPTVCAYLIYKTGSHLSPIIFLTFTGIAALLGTMSLPKNKLT